MRFGVGHREPRRHLVELLVLAVTTAGCASRQPWSPTPTRSDFADDEPRPHYILRAHAIRTANDDGSEETIITPQQLDRWLSKTNRILGESRAGIRLAFESQGPDWEPPIRDTIINHLSVDDRAGLDRANALARRYPGRLVFIFRFAAGQGLGANRGNGFSGLSHDFVALPAFEATVVVSNSDGAAPIDPEASTQNIWQMAHEVGHALGLPHTFASEYENAVQLTRLVANGGFSALDGDAIEDTPLDVGPRFITAGGLRYCAEETPGSYVGRRSDGRFFAFTVPFARHNVMGYIVCEPVRFSAEQVRIMRESLRHPRRRHLIETTGQGTVQRPPKSQD